jgi:hypothetical protein
MTQYDYWHGKKDVLTSNGTNPDIVIVQSIAANLLDEMGARGQLKGAALADYETRQNGRANNHSPLQDGRQ